MMSPMPAIVVRAAVPEDFAAIIDLVAGMFQDLGTMCSHDAWGDELQQALASRLWSDVAAFVAVDPLTSRSPWLLGSSTSDCPVPDVLRARLATSNGSRQLTGRDARAQLEPPPWPCSNGSMSTK